MQVNDTSTPPRRVIAPPQVDQQAISKRWSIQARLATYCAHSLNMHRYSYGQNFLNKIF